MTTELKAILSPLGLSQLSKFLNIVLSIGSAREAYYLLSTVPETAFGRFVTLQRVSSAVSVYELNWREVIVHFEAMDISDDDDSAVKIAIDTKMKH